ALLHTDDAAHLGEASMGMGTGGRTRACQRNVVAPSPAAAASTREDGDSALQDLHEPHRRAAREPETDRCGWQPGSFLTHRQSRSDYPIRRARCLPLGEIACGCSKMSK